MRSNLAGLFVMLLGITASAALQADPITGAPSHVVVVIEENHNLDQIIGNAAAPYMN